MAQIAFLERKCTGCGLCVENCPFGAIDMKDGQLGVKKKYRGKMTVCIRAYIDDLKAAYPKYDKTRCFVTHSCADAELVELAKERVRSEFDFREIIETVAGSVITGHCGRNTLGVLFIAE